MSVMGMVLGKLSVHSSLASVVGADGCSGVLCCELLVSCSVLWLMVSHSVLIKVSVYD